MANVTSFDFPTWKANFAKKKRTSEHLVGYYTDMLFRDWSAEYTLPDTVGEYLQRKGVFHYEPGAKEFEAVEALFDSLKSSGDRENGGMAKQVKKLAADKVAKSGPVKK